MYKGMLRLTKIIFGTIYKHYTILHNEKLQAHWYTTIIL